jgi:hypothetical protein
MACLEFQVQIYFTNVVHSGGGIDDNAGHGKFERDVPYFQSEEYAFTLRSDVHSGCSTGFDMIDAAGEHAIRYIVTYRRETPDENRGGISRCCVVLQKFRPRNCLQFIDLLSLPSSPTVRLSSCW